MYDELLTYEQVAKAFGVSRRTISRWIRAGKFPHPLRLGAGRLARFLPDDLNAHLIEQRRTHARPEPPNPKWFSRRHRLVLTTGDIGFITTRFPACSTQNRGQNWDRDKPGATRTVKWRSGVYEHPRPYYGEVSSTIKTPGSAQASNPVADCVLVVTV